MAVITSFDLLEGEDEHVSVHDQAGRPLPNNEIAWTLDPGLQGSLLATADPAGGFVIHASAAASGTLTLTATRGTQQVVKAYPVVVSAKLSDVVLETP